MLMQNESAFEWTGRIWHIAYCKVYTLIYQIDLQVEKYMTVI